MAYGYEGPQHGQGGQSFTLKGIIYICSVITALVAGFDSRSILALH